MWIPIQRNEQSAEPLYHQIEVQLRSLILSGQLQEGILLPSIREFAADLKCSVITIRRVYQDLEAEGLLHTRHGAGTFVAKISVVDQEQHKYESVREVMKTAVDTAKRVGCSKEEFIVMLHEVMGEHWEK